VQHPLADGPEVALQRLAGLSERPAGDVLLEVLGQAVQRLDEDLGVADLGERPAGVAEAGVLLAVGLLADHRTDQPEHRADLLETLAGLVDGLVPRPLVRPGEMFQGPVQLLPHAPPDAPAERLVGLQFKGHGVASCASGGGPAGVLPPAHSFLASALPAPRTVARLAGAPGRSMQ